MFDRGGLGVSSKAHHLDTPRVITNQTGQVVWRYDNTDPFGGNVPDENPSGLGTFTCNLRFPGQYFDQETNNHYNYFRDYEPGIGRYVQSDPIGLWGGPNTYAYVFNDPLSFVDPTGEIIWVPIIVGAALIAATQSSSFQNAAASAAQFYANQQNQTGNPLYAIPGALAALADPCNISTTATVLGLGLSGGVYLGRPYWQYYPATNPGYASQYMTRGWGWNPPYPPGPTAASKLGLPPYNPATAVRPVNPPAGNFVGGPTTVPSYTNPSYPSYFQPGGGIQYRIGGWP